MANRKLDINRLPSNATTVKPQSKQQRATVANVSVKERKPGYSMVIRDLSNTLFSDTVLPFVKDIVRDFVMSLLETALHGGEPRQAYNPRRRSYSKMYRGGSRRRVEPQRADNVRSVSDMVLHDVFFNNRPDAELVLGQLMGRIVEYGFATVGDYYQMVGVQSNYTHERYGWNRLADIEIIYTTDGYLINFPNPEYAR